MEIVELCSAAQRREALPILRELYPSLDEDRYARLLEEMVVDGYRQFAVRHEAGELVAVAGAAVHVNLYYGRHLYLYDLVVTEGVNLYYGRHLYLYDLVVTEGVNLYYGRHLYLYDLVVTEGVRSEGYGELLLDHVEGIARREGCETAALACGLEREGALRLYERRGYEKPSYAMRKALR